MEQVTTTRMNLSKVGHALGLHKSILNHEGSISGRDHIAETFEAVLGAVYVDSKYSISAVKDLVRKVGLADHKNLKTREELLLDVERRIRSRVQAAKAQVPGNQLSHAKGGSLSNDGSTSAGKSTSATHETFPQAEHRQTDFFTEDTKVYESYSTPLTGTEIEAIKKELLQKFPRLKGEIDKLNGIIKRRPGDRADAARKALQRSVLNKRKGKGVAPWKSYLALRQELAAARRAETDMKRSEEAAEARLKTRALEEAAEARHEVRLLMKDVEENSAKKDYAIRRITTTGPPMAFWAKAAPIAAALKESTPTAQTVDDNQAKKQAKSAEHKAKNVEELENVILQSHNTAWTSSSDETDRTPKASNTVSRDATVENASAVNADKSDRTFGSSGPASLGSQSQPEIFESDIDVVGFMKVENPETQKDAPSEDTRSAENTHEQNNKSSETAGSRGQDNQTASGQQKPAFQLEGRKKRRVEKLLIRGPTTLQSWTRQVAAIKEEIQLRPTILTTFRLKIAELEANTSSSCGAVPLEADPDEKIRHPHTPHLLMAKRDVKAAFTLADLVAKDLQTKISAPGYETLAREALTHTAAKALALQNQQQADSLKTQSRKPSANNNDSAGADQSAQAPPPTIPQTNDAKIDHGQTSSTTKVTKPNDTTDVDKVAQAPPIFPVANGSKMDHKQTPRTANATTSSEVDVPATKKKYAGTRVLQLSSNNIVGNNDAAGVRQAAQTPPSTPTANDAEIDQGQPPRTATATRPDEVHAPSKNTFPVSQEATEGYGRSGAYRPSLLSTSGGPKQSFSMLKPRMPAKGFPMWVFHKQDEEAPSKSLPTWNLEL